MAGKTGANHSEQLRLRKYGAEGADPEEVSRVFGINEATCRHFMGIDEDSDEDEDEDYENS